MEGNAREMTRLEQLAYKYKTDKFEHGYIPFYEKYLPKEPKRILEIGVKEGASLAMWAEYFPEAEIYGLDLFIEHKVEDVRGWLLSVDKPFNNIAGLIAGHSCDYLILEELRRLDFDLIIDDASHNSRDQMMTFFGLFNGKHYFIEDLHCCKDKPYTQGLPSDFRADYLFAELLSAQENYIDVCETYIDFNRESKIVLIKNA